MFATLALIASLYVTEPEEAFVKQWMWKQQFSNIQVKREHSTPARERAGYRQYVVKGCKDTECGTVKIYRIYMFYKVYAFDISEVNETDADPFKTKPLQTTKPK